MQALTELQTLGLDSLAQAADEAQLRLWHGTWLGRSGQVPTALKRVADIPASERKAYGQSANRVKESLSVAYEQALVRLQEAALECELQASPLDCSLPGRQPIRGGLHPSTLTLRRILGVFGDLGYRTFRSREVEDDESNFGLLNMPPHHPARDMWDTFHTTTPGLLLRTHTSPGQIHAMRQRAPQPIRVILPGMCHRYEQITARSEIMFHQVEGLCVGEGISMADLKGTLETFIRRMFGSARKMRIRSSYFPFTEPSIEVDMDCMLCGGAGCPVCKHSGWVEILGAGMVHPTVLRNGGYDPCKYSGFAFGMGPERITMLLSGIDDIRYFWGNDLRFLGQF
ncbi:MAG: phenylalanine--tRNA ligase subunit alpha [Planctomycetota bacterium]|nr:phenylalanine--tRNA ligase subunit alpha [Planctomycetota bacterium]